MSAYTVARPPAPAVEFGGVRYWPGDTIDHDTAAAHSEVVADLVRRGGLVPLTDLAAEPLAAGADSVAGGPSLPLAADSVDFAALEREPDHDLDEFEETLED